MFDINKKDDSHPLRNCFKPENSTLLFNSLPALKQSAQSCNKLWLYRMQTLAFS